MIALTATNCVSCPVALDPARACADGDLRIWAKPGGAPIQFYSFFVIHVIQTIAAFTRRGGEGVLGARMRVCSHGMLCGSSLTLFMHSFL